MAIITRLTRLFRADVHAVLDRLEEPEVLLRQAVREMEEQVAQNAQQLTARELDRHQTLTRMADIEAGLKASTEELDLCFAAGNETLLRTLLRRKLESERLIKHLGQHLASVSAVIDEQRRVLEEQRRQLDGMRQKAALFEADPACTRGAEQPRWNSDDFTVSDADVDLALLREQQNRRKS